MDDAHAGPLNVTVTSKVTVTLIQAGTARDTIPRHGKHNFIVIVFLIGIV
jgi:hypothetical protein